MKNSYTGYLRVFCLFICMLVYQCTESVLKLYISKYIEKRLQLDAQLGNCVLEDLELTVDVVHQVRYLRLRVQDLDALCVGVIAHTEWTRNRVGEFAVRREGLARLKDLYFITVLHGLLLGTLKAVGHIVEGLELGNGIFGNARNLWLEVLQLGLIG